MSALSNVQYRASPLAKLVGGIGGAVPGTCVTVAMFTRMDALTVSPGTPFPVQGREGWRVNHKRVERIWRQEGLKVPNKQPKRGRLWLNDGSCLRLRPCWPNYVWSYDFVADRTHDGRPLKIVDDRGWEFTRECLVIDVGRRLCSIDLVEQLFDLFLDRGVPNYIRSDNGPEFTAQLVREWLQRIDVKTLFIEPGSPWRMVT